MRAEDLMTSEVVTLHAQATIADAIALVTEHGVRHLPITGEDDHILGVVSDSDLRRVEGLMAQQVGEPDRSANVLSAPVAALLSGPPVCCRPTASVDEVIDQLLDEGVGAIVVTDEEGNIAGIVSVIDILEAARGRL